MSLMVRPNSINFSAKENLKAGWQEVIDALIDEGLAVIPS